MLASQLDAWLRCGLDIVQTGTLMTVVRCAIFWVRYPVKVGHYAK